eukprot:357773-Chlamydomonas_euryale.AAC.4
MSLAPAPRVLQPPCAVTPSCLRRRCVAAHASRPDPSSRWAMPRHARRDGAALREQTAGLLSLKSSRARGCGALDSIRPVGASSGFALVQQASVHG